LDQRNAPCSLWGKSAGLFGDQIHSRRLSDIISRRFIKPLDPLRDGIPEHFSFSSAGARSSPGRAIILDSM
jgi:hypothetical protein